MNFLQEFFATDGFMPHGMCLLWRPEIFWLMAITDSVIALSYYSIPLALAYFVLRRRDIAFPWLFQLFGAFILACGTTHLMAVWTLWRPDYVIDGIVKAITALLSVGTAALLWPLVPRALALPSPSQLELANEALRREVREREAAEAAVRQLNEDLEGRVTARAAELAQRERTYRAVIETALDAFILMDAEGRILEWSPKAEEMFGWSGQEARGRPVAELVIPPDQHAAHEAGLDRFLRTGEHVLLRRRVETAAMRRDGSSFPVELVIAPVRLDESWVFSGFVRDLSASRQAEEQLRQAQKMEAVGQLTGGMAHDFNNLLTALITSLDLLAPQVEDRPRAKDLTELALNAALRGADLTRHLLAFSRRQSLEAKAIDINQTVASTTLLLARTLGEQIEIEQRFAPDLPPAYADPAHVASALANLAINARDAMPNGGRLVLETELKHLDAAYVALNPEAAPGDYVMLAVSDTGAGMSAETLARVFEPFFTTKADGRGSGLGLSMVYGFAKQSGGHVKIYSEPGHGTTVRLYLPLADKNAAAEPARAPAAQGASKTATILIVEDNDDVRRGVMAQLAALGHTAIETAAAAEALAELETGRPIDLLFTDVVMPGMSGVELAAAARALRPGLKVLFTSGFTEASAQNGKLAGEQILSKPYRFSDLAAKIAEALEAEG